MKFVIMADGKSERWNNYLNTPKHLVQIEGEMLILRTIRLLRAICNEDVDIVVTSHDIRYEFEGCKRYEPKENKYEVDRFTEELIQDDICFLYGDTYYTEKAIKKIVDTRTDSILFFGDEQSIIAVKIKDGELFRKHKKTVKKMYKQGKITMCKGWQVYQSFVGQNLYETPQIKENYIFIHDKSKNINTPEDYEELINI